MMLAEPYRPLLILTSCHNMNSRFKHTVIQSSALDLLRHLGSGVPISILDFITCQCGRTSVPNTFGFTPPIIEGFALLALITGILRHATTTV